jgi:hypothetical protein
MKKAATGAMPTPRRSRQERTATPRCEHACRLDQVRCRFLADLETALVFVKHDKVNDFTWDNSGRRCASGICGGLLPRLPLSHLPARLTDFNGPHLPSSRLVIYSSLVGRYFGTTSRDTLAQSTSDIYSLLLPPKFLRQSTLSILNLIIQYRYYTSIELSPLTTTSTLCHPRIRFTSKARSKCLFDFVISQQVSAVNNLDAVACAQTQS